MEAKRKRTKNIIIAAVLVAVAILMAALPAMLSSGQKEENTGTAKSVAVPAPATSTPPSRVRAHSPAGTA